MGDFFGGLRSGIQFPQVVMNQGPLPGSGGLPKPLHDTPDARINYGSSLLGNLTPYAYGEPGYLSSQNAYLNIPHKIQKIVPVLYLPEAKNPARETVDLSHPIDDGDLAFVMRLDRNSMFCTGLKNTSMRRAGLGTAIDPFINLCTLNYILSGMQLGISNNDAGNLWLELLENMNRARFGVSAGRDYLRNPIGLNDVIHVIRHCIRPFGIARGSEKQGGQDESTLSPATWPVSFVISLTLDGKESNVLNIWHHKELSAGNDLVLRLKLMPIRQYTLNHYYKGVKRQAWDRRTLPGDRARMTHVWQLVPDVMSLDFADKKELDEYREVYPTIPDSLRNVYTHESPDYWYFEGGLIWQELGYWHIGRSQVMTSKYGVEEFWHNDLANSLKTNHLDITLQPVFQQVPFSANSEDQFRVEELKENMVVPPKPAWAPMLGLERLDIPAEPSLGQALDSPVSLAGEPVDLLGAGPSGVHALDSPASPVEEPVDLLSGGPPVTEAASGVEEPDWLGRLEFTDDSAAQEPPQKKASTGKARKGKAIGGSLLKADGSSVNTGIVGIL